MCFLANWMSSLEWLDLLFSVFVFVFFFELFELFVCFGG